MRSTCPKRRLYDRLAPVYPVSAMLFHSRAHRCALEYSALRDGMRVLEVGTGSGEMLRRVVSANGQGATIGTDLSPKMAAVARAKAQRACPSAQVFCHASDARSLPFRDGVFDRVICCFLLELLPRRDLMVALHEFRRVLKAQGRLAVACVAQRVKAFNFLYGGAARLVPAFWGWQVEELVPELLEGCGFRIVIDRRVRQMLYPARVFVAHL